jgi:acetyltransferase-like isoleucine patch superfamily enzyme
MADQPGAIRAVSIGPNVWIGAGARILNDVAPGTMVGAGAVVTRVFEENAILVGVPARRLRLRGSR